LITIQCFAHLDQDVSAALPYLNAVLVGFEYIKEPPSVTFRAQGKLITVYGRKIAIKAIKDENEALKIVEWIKREINDAWEKRDDIQPSYEGMSKPKVIEILKLLPKTNCKECGFSTCLAFAGALSKKQTTTDQCPGFARPLYENVVYPIYDKNGKLETTVEIEVDPDETKRANDPEGESIAKTGKKSVVLEQKNNAMAAKSSVGFYTELTDREIQVLRLVSEGATNTQISATLSISHHTVKSHVVNIFNKLGVNDRTQAAVWATRHGII